MAAATAARTAGRAAVNVVAGAAEAIPRPKSQGGTVLLVAGTLFAGYLFLSRRLEGVLRAGFGPIGGDAPKPEPAAAPGGTARDERQRAGSSGVGELREREGRASRGDTGEAIRRAHERRGEPDTYRGRPIKPRWVPGPADPIGRPPRRRVGTPPIVPWQGGFYG